MKAIETIYNGYCFRSRLEARWAVFFDTLGIKYEYEKEGYDLDGILYLPDFWLPELHCWAEIKPWQPRGYGNDVCKCLSLSQATHCRVLLIEGNPWLDDYYIALYEDGELVEWFLHFAWCTDCDTELWLRSDEWGELALNEVPSCHTVRSPSYDTPRLMAAYTAARQARFEHGERSKARNVTKSVPRKVLSERTSVYHPGDKVIHPLFGQGIVLTSEMMEGDEYVEVQFRDSRKRLYVPFARLSKQPK